MKKVLVFIFAAAMITSCSNERNVKLIFSAPDFEYSDSTGYYIQGFELESPEHYNSGISVFDNYYHDTLKIDNNRTKSHYYKNASYDYNFHKIV